MSLTFRMPPLAKGQELYDFDILQTIYYRPRARWRTTGGSIKIWMSNKNNDCNKLVSEFMLVEGNAAFSMQIRAITTMLYQLPYQTSASNSVPLFNPLKITITFQLTISCFQLKTEINY